ncbi:DUF6517 family protein [Halosegnis longus]|uniref:DUF6517 family protein n=1 Tax=Halosegnis longus TaxID=2216012 RepID=UPI00117DD6E9|nr:DUF6517 family protein [Salella cibi]
MDRREYLAAIGAIGLGSIAGCTEDTGDGDGGQDATEAPDTEESTTETQTTEEQTTEEQTTEQTSSSEVTYQVRIQYTGEWSGSIGGDGSVRSVDGSGEQTFDIEGDSFIVSANAQKQDDSSDTLTVQILENGEVIAERSTSAEYGIAQVTSEDGMGGGGSDSGSGGSGSESSFSVRVQYSGSWQGSIGTGGSTRTVEGSGSRTIQIDGSPNIISANAQKQDDNSDTLTIQILNDGEVVKDASTSAAYGIAQISYSNF